MSDRGLPTPMRGRARARHRVMPQQNPEAVVLEAGIEEVPAQQHQMLVHMYGASGNDNGNNDGPVSSSGSARGRGSPRGSTVASVSERPSRDDIGDPDYIVTRPEGFEKRGKVGNIINTVANYYKFKLVKECKMMLYAVAVTVDPPSDEIDDRKVRMLVRTKREAIGNYLLTGNQLVTTREIPTELLEPFQHTPQPQNPEEGPSPTYTATISYVRDVEEHEGVVIQFYNVIVRMIQKILNYAQLGRHFFNPNGKVEFEHLKLEVWPGFNNSIRAQDGGLMMNVESCWKVLMTQSVFEKMTKIRTQDPQNFQENCNNAIVGLMVVTPYNPKSYKIDRIDYNVSCNDTFNYKGQPTSYADYYRRKYQQEIRFPEQPLLVSKPTHREQKRGMVGDIYLIPELCFPCGLNDEMRANFKLMKALASCFHMEATKRVETMQNFIDSLRRNADIQAQLNGWGAAIRGVPVDVVARQVPHEKINYGSGDPVNLDDKVDWTMGFRNRKSFVASALKNWAIVVSKRDYQSTVEFIKTMQKVGGPIGFTIAQPMVIEQTQNNNVQTYTSALNTVMTKAKGNLDMILIVLPSPNADLYAAVKYFCSISHGIPSQCFLSKHFGNRKGLMSICTKMVVQMCAKVGGEPWGVTVPMKNLMVIGYDVHHGPAGTRGASIAAMTATFNLSLGRSFSKIAPLPSREEVANTVAKMFEDCLRGYFKQNQALPERIMIYRDGVGKGQLNDVYNHELVGIQQKITLRYEQKSADKPRLSYIIVNKRINTRFFRKDGPKSYNSPPPGTVVDDIVTRPERYDFFLISQTARQGCVSPTYYNVIHDQSGLDPDKIQRFTYKLCHLYYNWSGTVAVPAPCQNAHKLAFQTGTALMRVRGIASAGANERLAYLPHYL